MKTLTTIRRLTAVAAATAAVVALAACGTDDNTGSRTGSTGASTSSQAAGPTDTAATPDTASSDTAATGTAGADMAANQTTFSSAGFHCATGTLRSSGSTAQGKVMAQMITAYNSKCGASINDYGGGGSGQGVTDFVTGQTDFGGSDSPMSAAERADAAAQQCDGSAALDLPMVTGPIAVAYHLTGIDSLVLTPDVLSGIFGGKITHWDDPAITAINPGTKLPNLAITSVHRAEDSGTTDNFTKYLAAAGGWTFPGGKAWSAPGGTAAQGSDGVASAIQSTEGAIGYVEWGYAQQDKLATAAIDNGAGPVTLSAESAGKAVAAAKVTGTGGDLTLALDYRTKAPGTYPIVLVTYELVCSAGNGTSAGLLRSFLGYIATDGQRDFVGLGAAPLPEQIRTKVVAAIAGLR